MSNYEYEDGDVSEEDEQKQKTDGILQAIGKRTAYSFTEPYPPSYKIDSKTAELRKKSFPKNLIQEAEAKVVRELQCLKNYAMNKIPFATKDIVAAKYQLSFNSPIISVLNFEFY